MLVLALSYLLLVVLGQAGEQIGFDKKLKVNTVKTRIHSLHRVTKIEGQQLRLLALLGYADPRR